MSDKLDEGDKVTASITFKKNLGDFQSIDFYCGVSMTKRGGETDDDIWNRAWGEVTRELEVQMDTHRELVGRLDPRPAGSEQFD